MRKRIKIWFHSGTTSDIKELSIRKAVLGFFVIIGIATVGAASFIGYDYYQLKKNSFENVRLTQTVLQQNNEIKIQRTQIQSFAGKIENLKNKIHDLSIFEDKIRLIADIGKNTDSSGFIGIGSIPEDSLDTDISLDQKHNNLMRQMHQQVSQTHIAATKQTLDFKNLIKMLEQKRNLLAATPSIKPVNGGWLTSSFGYRKSPFTGQKEFHAGLDIASRSGTKIFATANGRISHAARKTYIGNQVVIDHGHGRVSKYGHMKKILVKRGQKVKRGDVIGILGNSGRSTGPHVHYEIRVNGTPVNPLKYILN